jgi:hypothetical protein
MGECLAAPFPDSQRDDLAIGERAARDDDLGSVLSEPFGDCAPNAAARSGDDSDFAAQVEGMACSLRVTYRASVRRLTLRAQRCV